MCRVESKHRKGRSWLILTHSLYVFGVSLEWIMKPSLRRVSEAITAKLSPAMARMVLYKGVWACTDRRTDGHGRKMRY